MENHIIRHGRVSMDPKIISYSWKESNSNQNFVYWKRAFIKWTNIITANEGDCVRRRAYIHMHWNETKLRELNVLRRAREQATPYGIWKFLPLNAVM